MAKKSGSNFVTVKKQNTRLIKEIIYKYSPISRSEIAEMLSLTPPTITGNVSEMLSAGYLRELADDGGREDGVIGRKPVGLDFVSNKFSFIGVELVPGTMLGCVMNLRGESLCSQKEIISQKDYDSVLSQIFAMVTRLIEQSGVERHRIFACGIGVPGFVDEASGIVRSLPKFNWANKPLARDMHEKLGIPVCIENNAKARAIGEDIMNKKLRPESFAYLFVSKGIACPLMIKDSYLFGQVAGAGEIGHSVVQPDGPKCTSCGNYGCLEAYSSETAIINRCRDALQSGRAPILAKNVRNPESPTLDEILSAQELGDDIVGSILQVGMRYLAVTLANLTNFVSPRLILVDAYIMKTKANQEYFRRSFWLNVYGLNSGEVTLEFKSYDELNGCKSAAAVAIQRFFICDEIY